MKYAGETYGNSYKKDKNVNGLVIQQATYHQPLKKKNHTAANHRTES